MVKLRNHRLSGECVGMQKAIQEAHAAAARVELRYEVNPIHCRLDITNSPSFHK
jgi:hypothetical protein